MRKAHREHMPTGLGTLFNEQHTALIALQHFVDGAERMALRARLGESRELRFQVFIALFGKFR
jgi:hypothetical protein